MRRFEGTFDLPPPFVISPVPRTRIYLAESHRDHALECDGSSMASHGIWIYGKYLVGWATHPVLKNDGVKVNWDDEIPNINGKIKHGNQTTNQYGKY